MHDITKLSDEFIQGIKGFSDTIWNGIFLKKEDFKWKKLFGQCLF